VKIIDWGLSGYVHQNPLRSRAGTVAYMAPEVIQCSDSSAGYSFSCDIWSFGVLAYVTLSGRYPFACNGHAEAARNIMAGEFSFDGSEWARVSTSAKDFISICLKSDPTLRPSASATLKHKWFRRACAESPIDALKARRVLDNLDQASKAAYPASVYAALVARQMDHQSLRELPAVFQEFDLDGNGELKLSEFKAVCETVYGRDSAKMLDIEKMFDFLDLDGSKNISYTEFIAAGLGESVRTEESLKIAFKAFDVCDDNQITRSEFEQVVAKFQLCEQSFAAEGIFSEFDVDENGALDFEEWKAWANSRLMRDSFGAGDGGVDFSGIGHRRGARA